MAGSVPNFQELGIHKAEGEMLAWFRNEVAQLIGVKGFPGSQPVSFSRRHFDELKKHDYYVCEKSDGIRCLLYFTRQQNAEGGFEEIHFLIDRKNDFYQVPGLHFPQAPAPPANPNDPTPSVDFASWHSDSLLDGELLWDTYPDGRRELKYLVFDSLCVDGKLLLDRPLHKRLAYFLDMIYKPYKKLLEAFPKDCSSFVFRLEQKSFQLAYGMEMMFRQILPNLPHGNDGLIFTCTETPYKFKTDEHILKWKPAEENTIDFRMGLEFPEVPVSPDAEEWEYDYGAMPKILLWVFHGDERDEEYWDDLYLTEQDWQKMKQWSVERDDGLHGQVIECYLNSDQRWRFHRFRDDKKTANHISVVHKVMESIRDGVTKDDLTAAAGNIKAAWKTPEREARRRAANPTIESSRRKP